MPPPEVDYGSALLRMFLSLAVCIILLVATVWFLRRLMRSKFQRSTAEQTIHILEKRMISPKSTLYLVEIEGEKMLIAESQFDVKIKHLREAEKESSQQQAAEVEKLNRPLA